jgi:hypothetical protein
MTGKGQFGALDMGGMFTVVKVRRGQKRGDYSDPGPFRHPAGTVAYEFTGQLPDPTRAAAAKAPAGSVEVQVRKPASGHGGH